jgi:cytoskeleton protein RodZ
VTTREHARPAGTPGRDGDGGRGRETRTPPAGERLADRLVAAREARGIDLLRAERETKIRRQYLAAMERGAWEELPAGVYARGFLRNYALYLGLDADEILTAWNRERGEVPVEPSIVVPRPITAPRRGVVLGPGIVVAALVSLAAVAIIAYIGFQLLRFSEPPPLAVTDPPTAVTEVAEETTSYTLQGTTVANGEVTIKAPGRQDVRVIADGNGVWRTVVDLRRGENRFVVTAADPGTGKEAETPVEIVITVPFAQVAAPTLELTSPEDGLSVENGAIPVRGTTTDATSVSVSAAYLGTAPGQPAPGSAAPTPPAVPAADVELADDGSFATAVDLTEGRWAVTVTAAGEQGKSTTLTRNVTVVYQGVSVVVEIRGQRTWLKVWVDGVVTPDTGAGGKVFAAGKTLTYRGQEFVVIRTGKMSTTFVTVNGTDYGALGATANPGTFRLEAGKAPQAAN